jgi:histidinol-phosphatase (PHP family)
MLTNHHTHSLYSDGSSQPEDYITTAIEKGFNLLGFTEHSPLPFENTFSFKKENKEEYLSLMNALKLFISACYLFRHGNGLYTGDVGELFKSKS